MSRIHFEASFIKTCHKSDNTKTYFEATDPLNTDQIRLSVLQTNLLSDWLFGPRKGTIQ